MKPFRLFAVAACLSLLNACATVPLPSTITPEFWQPPAKKVAVSVQPLPKPISYKMGNQGLLDVLINEAIANTSGWDTHVESLIFEPYEALAEELSVALKSRGLLAEVVSMDLTTLQAYKATPAQKGVKPVFDKNLSALGKDGQDYLLLVKVNAVGTARDYYGFVPLSPPRGYLQGYATLLDLHSNEILWWKDILVTKGVSDPWDQAPAYPNLSQAVDQAIEQSREEVMTALLSSAPLVSPVVVK